MTARLAIDKAGRVVLPKPVREKLRLAQGDELELQTLDDRITLRPVRGATQLRKKSGVWVFQCGEPLSASTVDETIEHGRRERDKRNARKIARRDPSTPAASAQDDKNGGLRSGEKRGR